MARFNGKDLIGSLGNVAFKTVDGITYLQTKPGRGGVRQTKATKKAASDFGTASSTTKMLTIGLRILLQTYYPKNMFNSFRSVVYNAMLANTLLPKGTKNLWEGDLDLLTGFEFNTSSLYAEYCRVLLDITENPNASLTLQTPGFVPADVLLWPATASSAVLCYNVTYYQPDTYKIVQQEVFKVAVADAVHPITAQSFTTQPIAAPALALVSSCVLYFKEDALLGSVCLNHKALHPMQLLQALRMV